MAIITNLLPPTEGIRHQEPNTGAMVEQKELGKGTLYIAESRVVWVGERGEGLSLEYSNISVHAISRDISRFPQECLFLLTSRGEDEENEEGNSSSSDEEEDDPSTEIRFIPENTAALDSMFKALSECQALNSVEEDDAASYNGEEGGIDEEDGDDEIGAGDPGAYSNGQNEELMDVMDVGQLDEEGPEH